MPGTQDQIVNFLKSKGLNRAAIAGIMGNLMTESSLNPGALNGNEGAIGLVQWEGGRRQGLQSFAAAHGLRETDVNAQLGFMWQELTGSYSGVLSALKNVTNPAQAASIWDSQYEVSAGTSRTQRVNYANQFYSQGSLSGVSTNSTGETLLTSGGGGGTQPVDYAAALGNLAGLLQTVPEMKTILKQAQTGGWSQEKFLQAAEQSNWWRQHNDAARQIVGLQLADPAEYQTRMANAQSQVSNLAHQLGVSLSATSLRGLAMHFLVQGWDQQTLQHQVGQFFTGQGGLHGQAAAYADQLKQLYGDYGLPVSNGSIGYSVRQLLEGATTLDTYKHAVINQAKSLYPSLGHSLDNGMTVKDLAAPYIQTMAGLLEIDPANLNLTDPTIKRALQGSVVNTPGGKPTATTTTLYDFEKQVRSDPRWAKTQNATDTISTALLHVGKDFGFGGFN